MLGALFEFKGRLSRPGFWEVVFSIVLIDVLLLLASMYVADSGLPGGFGPSSGPSLALLSAAPWVLVVFTAWSLLAAMVKRCHDRSRSGLLVLVGLIPVIGWLWLFVDLFVLEGVEGKNRYGRPPHSHGVDAEAEARQRFDWGAEPMVTTQPAPAAAPLEAVAPEPLEPEPVALEPVQAHSDTVDVYVPEHPAPESVALAVAEHQPHPVTEAATVVEPAAEAVPETAPEQEAVVEPHAMPEAAPELHEAPVEVAHEHEPELPLLEAAQPVAAHTSEETLEPVSEPRPEPEPALQIMPEPRQAPAQGRDFTRTDLRPLVLDGI